MSTGNSDDEFFRNFGIGAMTAILTVFFIGFLVAVSDFGGRTLARCQQAWTIIQPDSTTMMKALPHCDHRKWEGS